MLSFNTWIFLMIIGLVLAAADSISRTEINDTGKIVAAAKVTISFKHAL